MRVEKSNRGFEVIVCEEYAGKGGMKRLLQQSSAIGDYGNSMDQPGSSYLWVGDYHHLDREEVSELVEHLNSWLSTGSLKLDKGR